MLLTSLEAEVASESFHYGGEGYLKGEAKAFESCF
jgi:hypothetical protein